MSDFEAYEKQAVGAMLPQYYDGRQPDKEAALSWLREHGYVAAYLEYSGGHDEGGADNAVLTKADGSQDILSWQEDGFTILEAPIAYKYGSWAGEYRAWGTLRYDVEAGTCVMEDTFEVPQSETTTYNL